MPDDVERRRFPPPWTFEDHNDACFIVKDATRSTMRKSRADAPPPI
jgi:hypothetical protein